MVGRGWCLCDLYCSGVWVVFGWDLSGIYDGGSQVRRIILQLGETF